MIKEISILIPVLNEEDNLPNLIDDIYSSLNNLDLNYEIIIVDDFSKIPVSSYLNGKNLKIFRNSYRRGQSFSLFKAAEKSKYEYLANLPESKDINEAVNNAMLLIEKDHSDLAGILPKNYQDFGSDLLKNLIRIFNTESIRSIPGDAFGRIYEYFLMKFSMSGAGAQEGGEFFTPPSLVQLIVNFIEPKYGIVHDPACGSGGMFIQTAQFINDKVKKSLIELTKLFKIK